MRGLQTVEMEVEILASFDPARETKETSSSWSLLLVSPVCLSMVFEPLVL